MDEQECESEEKCDIIEATEVEAVLNGAALPRELSGGDAASKKVDWEIPRKLLHSSIGFGTVYLYVTNGDVKTVIVLLWTALAVIVPADILRLQSPAFERIYERCLGFLMRECEKVLDRLMAFYVADTFL